MNLKSESITSLKIYFSIIALFWLAAIYLLLTYGYHGSFLFLNKNHSPFFDNIVPHATHVGDSLILSALMLIIFSNRNLPMAFTIVISILVSGLVLISLKNFIFHDWHRPLTVLGEKVGIHYVEGHIEYYKAFPSGHTTTIFSAFPLIALLFHRKGIQVLLGVGAILFAYTRIYLGSHFLGDVLAGSILGTTFAVICLYFVYPWLQKSLSSKGEETRKRIRTISICIGVIAFVIGISIRYAF